MTCSVNCLDNPDSVDKIKWKCVECETNLEQICKDSRKEKADAASKHYQKEAKAVITSNANESRRISRR